MSKFPYFKGWYFKHQTSAQSIAFIPAYHIDKEGLACASLQVITNDSSYFLNYPIDDFFTSPGNFLIQVGDSTFSDRGCRIRINTKKCNISGRLKYGSFHAPSTPVMGPFHYLPFMQCSHDVYSLFHTVNGRLTVNGETIIFQNDIGYLEGDKGTSFPKKYLWTQCSWGNNAVMVSIADIPFLRRRFTGCICSIYFQGHEYRLATYKGVRLLACTDRLIILRQGRMTLRVELLESHPLPLRAPREGNMTSAIHESLSCRVRYTCMCSKQVLFDFVSSRASFEDHWTLH